MSYPRPEGFNIAQINIATMLYDLDDPRMAAFVSALGVINGLAERSDGFVWRYSAPETDGEAVVRVNNNPRTIVQMSVWSDARSLERFVWKTAHVKVYGRRREWFEPDPAPNLAFWYVPPSSFPAVQDGYDRYLSLRSGGPSGFAFGWAELQGAATWQSLRSD
jgi:Domain of unknown function (DUF3291)